MDSTAIINASPLIFLSRGRHLSLLQDFACPVLVPDAVAAEIRVGLPGDPAVLALTQTPWLNVIPVSNIPDVIREWGLGPGESSVLALAQASPGTDAIVDDLAARRCAAALSIPVRGTLGIVLTAKRRGLIRFARPVMEDLIQAGL